MVINGAGDRSRIACEFEIPPYVRLGVVFENMPLLSIILDKSTHKPPYSSDMLISDWQHSGLTILMIVK